MIKQFVNYAFLIFNLGLIFMFFNNLERSFKIPETLHRPIFFMDNCTMTYTTINHGLQILPQLLNLQ